MEEDSFIQIFERKSTRRIFDVKSKKRRIGKKVASTRS